MGGFLCKAGDEVEGASHSRPSRRVRSRTTAQGPSPSVASVLGSFDLLHQVLSKLAPNNGCTLAARLQVALVCRLWRDVAKTLPISLQLVEPLSEKQLTHLKAGTIPSVKHIGFVGSKEANAHELLTSNGFANSSSRSLTSISGLSFQDDLSYLGSYGELRAVGLCRRHGVTLLELVRGTRHSLHDLAALGKLQSLTLTDLAGPQAALDLSKLPNSLQNLHLVNTSFVHHPEMELPEGLHLHSLTATSLGRRSTIVPVELLRRTKQAILKGKEVYLTGNPTEHPEMADDSIEIIMNGGMLFLFGFGMPQVQHETSTSKIMRQLEDSDLQVLRLCTEVGGTTHLVNRSDCRKGLRWKSLEIASESNFVRDVSTAGESPPSGFGCKIEERHPDGSIHSMCLSRAGTPNFQAEAAVNHLMILQQFLVSQLQQLEDHVRHLGEMLEDEAAAAP